MSKRDRSAKKPVSRKENTRELQKTVDHRSLLNFNFKYFDGTQPNISPQPWSVWEELQLLSKFNNRLVQLSSLTRDEAIKQGQIRPYFEFPSKKVKSQFCIPRGLEHVDNWAVLKGLGGLTRVAGFIEEDTFYVVFLDKDHQFWPSPKKHT